MERVFGKDKAQKVNLNPFLLRAILGHSQTFTTDRYCHARGEAIVVDIAEILEVGVSPGCESSSSDEIDVL